MIRLLAVLLVLVATPAAAERGMAAAAADRGMAVAGAERGMVIAAAERGMVVGAAARAVIARAAVAGAVGARPVAFLARDASTGAEVMLEGSDLETRHSPYSTFKIPNLMLALEAGAAVDAPRRWDPARRPPAPHWPDGWRQDQTLRTAFERSAVWVFQDVARELGGATYRDALARWSYGNAAAPDGSDTFWLDGTLRISVAEQVAFLDALLAGELGVSAATLETVAGASRAGRIGTATLHGKTGAGRIPGDRDRWGGWYVGFVARLGAPPVAFALYTEGDSWPEVRDARQPVAIRLLEEAGVLPAR